MQKISKLVWEKYTGRGSKKLVLLLIAELSKKQPANPSIEYIAKTCNISVRMAQYIVNEMIEEGLLVCHQNDKGGKHGSTRHLSINISALTGAMGFTPTGAIASTRVDKSRVQWVAPNIVYLYIGSQPDKKTLLAKEENLSTFVH